MRIILTCVLLFVLAILGALPVNDAQARTAATNFLAGRHQIRQIDDGTPLTGERGVVGWLYQTEPTGFVVTTADTELEPILAYSFHQNLEIHPDNYLYRMILADIELRRTWIDETRVDTSANQQRWSDLLNGVRDERPVQQWPADNGTLTDGWLLTQWNQSGPYNRFCPLDGAGQRSVVGCVATAMSMILHFHKYVGEVSFNTNDRYYSGWGSGRIRIDQDAETKDFPNFSELNAYLETLDDHYEQGVPLTNDDLAALCFAAGISVEMSYSSTGSGAFTSDVPDRLISKFGYTDPYWIDYSDSFNDILAEEMQAIRPAELSIYQADWENGHAINADGYNTNGYFHLNYGWGTSNSSCWYSLPEGMPSSYCIIGGAAINIEAGVVPVAVSGSVDLEGLSPAGTYIRFDGADYDFEVTVTQQNGQYNITHLLPGHYTVTATHPERVWYQSFEVDIDAENNEVNFDMDHYEALTGAITAPVSPEGARVVLYGLDLEDHDTVLATTTVNGEGSFSIPEVLPGDYTLFAGLPGGYYGSVGHTLTADNQHATIELNAHEGQLGISYAKSPSVLFTIPTEYTLSCGIRLTPADMESLIGNAVTSIRFKSPISSDEGEITAQLWENQVLIDEIALSDLVQGEWRTVEFPQYMLIREDRDYYVGYRIHTVYGPIAWHDAGPSVSGRGAYIRSTSWLPLSGEHDFNFCIEPIISTDVFGTVTGTISLTGGTRPLSDVIVKAGNYATHPEQDGVFSLVVTPGDFTVTAYLDDYSVSGGGDVSVSEDGVVTGVDFDLQYSPSGTETPGISPWTTALRANRPNPFNPETVLSFSLGTDSPVELVVYNVRGERVRTLVNATLSAGVHEIRWDGRDDGGRSVSSGVYFQNLEAGPHRETKRMLLLK